MELNTELTQLLQDFCSDGVWKYAVFWSLKSGSLGTLTWGDGYVASISKDIQIRDLYEDPIDSNNQRKSFSWFNNGQCQSYPLCPIEAALLSMSSHCYSPGEEIIGKVAVTGQHCWISCNDLCSTFMYKYHEDWQLQFAAGIKTVLLIPVIPHGVLQLGSLYMVLESSELVTVMKDLFYKLYDPSIPLNCSATGFGYSNTSTNPTANMLLDPSDVLADDLFGLIKSSAQLLTTDQPFTMSEFPILEDNNIGAHDASLADCTYETLDADLWTSVQEESSDQTYCNTTLEPDMANLPFMGKLANLKSKLNCKSVIGIGESEYDDLDGISLTYMAQEFQEHAHGSTVALNDDLLTSDYSIYSKLHKNLEAMSREELEKFICNSVSRHQDSAGYFLLQANGNKTVFHSPLENNYCAEFLLDATIDQVGNVPNSESSQSSDSPISCAIQTQGEDHVVRPEELAVPNPPGDREFSPTSINEGFTSSKMTFYSLKETNQTITEDCTDQTIHEMHGTNSVDVKKECRKVELNRTRPRDRQLIQDRMKELRELIPNTSKCSIDALLDKTITHLIFLQSVSEKAEKLQNKMGKEELREEARKQLESCPLRVEELDRPGHLLIEMLCKEYEVFFETAHMFKGLNVSILKGELEYSSGKLWARFVIEASEGLNQMHILCPLMHMLQRR